MSNLVTPIGRLSFPKLFTPEAPVPDAAPKYSATLLLPKDGEGVAEFMQKVRAAIQEAIAVRWPNPESRPKQLHMAIKDGDTATFTAGVNAGKLRKEKYPEMAGCWIIQASSKQAPGVVDLAGNPVTDERIAYPGVRARISFNIYAYENVNVGVSCGLGNVLIVGGGDPFGQATRPEDDFGKFIEEAAGSDAFAETAAVPAASAPEFDDIPF